MRVYVDVDLAGQTLAPTAVTIRAEVRDAFLEDAPAEVLGRGERVLSDPHTPGSVTVPVEVTNLGRSPIVWVHVDLDGDGRVSRGDLVTVQSFPVPAGDAPRVLVFLQQV